MLFKFYDLAVNAKLDNAIQERCLLIDGCAITNEDELIITLLWCERLWGVDFCLLSGKDKAAAVNEEFNHIMKKDVGVEAVNERQKQETRTQRMELVAAPTPAEVKNKALKMWMAKVTSKVSQFNDAKRLISWWYKMGASKFSTEVLEQWAIKNNSTLSLVDGKLIDFVLGKISCQNVFHYLEWLTSVGGEEFMDLNL